MSASLLVEQSHSEPSIIEPSGAELSIEPRKPLSDEPTVEQPSAKPGTELSSAEPIVELSSIELSSTERLSTELLSTEPIVEQSGAELSIELPRSLGDERSVEQLRAEPSTELSSAKPIAVPLRPLGAVSLRPLGDSLTELSSTEPIIEPTGAEPSIELPRPLSDEPNTEQLSAELSAELSSSGSSSAEPIVELPMPSSAEPSVELPRPSSTDVRGKWSRGKLLKTCSSAEPKPKPKPSSAALSGEPTGPTSPELSGKTEPRAEPPRPSSAVQSVNPVCAVPGGELLQPSSAELRGKWPRGKLLKTLSAEPKPSGAEPRPSSAEPSAEPPRLSSTELIGKLTGPTSAEPRPSSSGLIIESTSAKLIAEHRPRPSIAEQSRPSGAEPGVKLPRPSITG